MERGAKIFSLFIVLYMMLSLFAACNEDKNSQKKSSEEPLEQAKLLILTGADQTEQPDAQIVWDEIAKVTADNINIKIEVQSYAWGDYVQKVNTMAAAGQVFDIYLNFQGFLSGDVSKKQCIELDELIDKYGENIKKMVPADLFSDVSLNGKIYGIPSNYPVAGGTAFIIRKDLREKYNIPEIKDLSGFEAYLEAVTTGEKGMAGFVGRGGAGGLDFDLAFGPDVLNIGSDMAVFAEIDPDIKPYKAANKLTSDSFKKRMEWLKKAYKNGWIPRDILTIRDENTLLASGKAAALCNDMWTVNSLGPIVRAYIPGGELETFTFRDYSMPMIRMTKVNNFACISSTSNNKERAMMFLDWMRASKENYELYMYGIKGKHWNPIGDNQYELPEGVDPAKKPYNPSPWWAKVMQFDRLDKLSEPGFLHIYNQVVDAKYTTPELINFSFDSEPVKTEWVQVGAAYAEIMGPIGQGINDSEADYLAAIKRFDELGMQKIIDEIQRQLDAWAAKNKE
jgi:putative aldouronate transport system substrate-binding protein